jgi:hypothetical protein
MTDMGYGPHSDHYGDGVQPLDLIDSMELGFYEGQVIKYVSRWEAKGGLKDLEKAAFYLNRLIGLVKDEFDQAVREIHPGGVVRQPSPVVSAKEILDSWHGKKASDKPPLTWTAGGQSKTADEAQAALRARAGENPLPPEQQACR